MRMRGVTHGDAMRRPRDLKRSAVRSCHPRDDSSCIPRSSLHRLRPLTVGVPALGEHFAAGIGASHALLPASLG
jgi:hypothetical protein